MNVINIFFGVIILTLGRRLFWLFVGIVGFLLGFNFAQQIISSDAQWLVILIGVVVGLVGAILAMVLQRLAAGLVGFLAGGYIALDLMRNLNAQVSGFDWIPFLIGGVIGAILVMALYDWGLILVSSLIGASLIVQNLNLGLNPTFSLVIMVALVVIGIVIQAGMMQREGVPPPRVQG